MSLTGVARLWHERGHRGSPRSCEASKRRRWPRRVARVSAARRGARWAGGGVRGRRRPVRGHDAGARRARGDRPGDRSGRRPGDPRRGLVVVAAHRRRAVPPAAHPPPPVPAPPPVPGVSEVELPGLLDRLVAAGGAWVDLLGRRTRSATDGGGVSRRGSVTSPTSTAGSAGATVGLPPRGAGHLLTVLSVTEHHHAPQPCLGNVSRVGHRSRPCRVSGT